MPVTRLKGPNDLRDAYRRVVDRIHAAVDRSARRHHEVIMVAVTGDSSPDAIRTLVELGHRDFGELHAQQLSQRVVSTEEFLGRKRFLSSAAGRLEGVSPKHDAVRWHLVGHLDRQRARQIVPLVKLIHSVDSLRLAEELHTLGASLEARRQREEPRPIQVLLQVNPLGDDDVNGIAAPAAKHLAEQIDTMVHLSLRGLMVRLPAQQREDESLADRTYARALEIFHEIHDRGTGGERFNLLSMGGSDDFETAIRRGANVIRISRALFGEGN